MMCCSGLQWVAVSCSVLRHMSLNSGMGDKTHGIWQHIAVYCSVLQCVVAVCCSVLRS